MDTNEKAALAEAIEALIESTDAKDIYKKMLWVLELSAKGLPVQLTGRPSVLNPLMNLFLTDAPTAERVMELVERKRTELDQPPLDESTFDRNAYMRELMAMRRERLSRLTKLVNELRSDHDKIKGTARLEFEQVHAQRWFAVRNEREDAMRERLGRRLTQDERRGVIQRFWADVDAELASLEEFVRQEVRKPLTARAPNGFVFKLQPTKGS